MAEIEYAKIIQAGSLQFDLEQLARFLVDAKRTCYAGEGEEEVMEDGSKKLRFDDGRLFYEDNYSGFYHAPGTEIVRWGNNKGQRIWQMSYSGGMETKFWGNRRTAKDTFAFLKKALSKVSIERPFRGPEPTFKADGFLYVARTEGDITRFKGCEAIGPDEELHEFSFLNRLFTQDYIGGVVIPK
ncbi:hypothetical protein HYT56_02095 [Candidatus Woesearchaeota archaeon]|nr:hypothetical protein [Candidatus Woesearchaeota archaeon]